MNGGYLKLQDLEVYGLVRKMSKVAWLAYQELDWKNRKIIGDQFIESIDSVGANIAEGYFRYHYLDKIKFYYNARASCGEAISHWLSLLNERGMIRELLYKDLVSLAAEFSPKFNKFINVTYEKNKNKR